MTLENYLPPFVRNNAAVGAVLGAENRELELLSEAVRDCLDCAFPAYADSRGLERWEALLGINAAPGDSPELRRIDVLARLGDSPPYTISAINAKLDEIVGAEYATLVVNGDEFTASLRLKMAKEKFLPMLERYLRQRLPANLDFAVVLLFATHGDVGEFTHGELAESSHLEIRRNN